MIMMTVNNYKLLRSLSSSLTSFNRQRHARLVSSFSRPAPPPLPPKQQREFEELVRAAATPASNSQQNNTIDSGAELHPDARRSPSSEFEGDTNPVTGEVNGPKTEPVRHGDWSFGGQKKTDIFSGLSPKNRHRRTISSIPVRKQHVPDRISPAADSLCLKVTIGLGINALRITICVCRSEASFELLLLLANQWLLT
ncbi:hypothetical protein PNOK_0525500 [Pyrrhoderma noxium]|uniref:Succinate dehydrogenase assembly factor 4, mitochondrial n=1 Tax=Pyrrhoderma noxium TaxID=2282107 RepID=A0A286UFP0_9AGAM|nr:hypothetical protein PNOK_0525500 [Pyrrhoderma noxium]